LSGNKPAGAILHAAVSEAREKCGMFAQDISVQPFVKLTTDNPDVLSQIEPSAPTEQPSNEIPVNPIVFAAIDDNNHQSLSSAAAIPALTELVSAISASGQVEKDVGPGTDGQTEGGTPGELLTLLDKMTGADTPDETLPTDDPSRVTVDPLGGIEEKPVDVPTTTLAIPGEHFWDWLGDAIEEGVLTVNKRDSLLHIMAQYVFIQTPDCFYRYLATQEKTESDKDDIQKSFEALNKHFSRSGKGIYIYKKYENEGREGRFTRMSGYMILATQLFKEGVDLSDSQWLSPNK